MGRRLSTSRGSGLGPRLGALALWIARRRVFVVAAWAAVIVACLPLAAQRGEHLRGGGDIVPGSESAAVRDAATSRLGGAGGEAVGVVIKPSRDATPQARMDALERARAALARHLGAPPPAPNVRRARAELARGEPALLALTLERDSPQLVDPVAEIREELDSGEPAAGVTSYVVGQASMWAGVRERGAEELRNAEIVGLPLVAIVLLAVFGSLAAASLPFVLGVTAVVLTGAVTYLVSREVTMSIYATNVASLVGIGVAVDYSLFVLARYRSELIAGASQEGALAKALSTSGRAITVSGAAVAISLAAVFVADLTTLRSMAFAAIVVVCFAVLVTTTLLPALINLLGDRLAKRRRRVLGADADGGRRWDRWAAAVTRRPALTVLAVTAVLLTLGLPALSMETTAGPVTQLPPDDEVRQGLALVAAERGGHSSLRVLLRSGERAEVMRAARRALTVIRGDPEVASARVLVERQGLALIEVVTRGHAEAPAALGLARRLRTELPADRRIAATVDVGGESARVEDVRRELEDALVPIVVVLLASAFVILAATLRSIVLPLKAVLMNLLSVGAAWGVLVAVFQWDWLDGLLGYHEEGQLSAIAPIFVLTLAFGLSMDYELFLLSRIRERYGAHGDSRRAVREGLASSAGPITSAALIMTAVFLAFVFTGVASVKEIGLGAAVAIAVDATLVRLVLVPAAMELFGRWNWWWPRWLGAPRAAAAE